MTNKSACSAFLALVAISAGSIPAFGTEPFGVTAQPLRSSLPARVLGFQEQPHLLLLIGQPGERKRKCNGAERDSDAALQMNSSGGNQEACEGYDVFETINTFAPAVLGKPSQSGWHDHPIPVGVVQIIGGTLFTQDADELGCLKKYPTGSVLIEHRGDIHNAFNFDPTVPAVLRSVFFIAHSEALTRTDRPDPITGDPNVASAPPTQVCSH